MKHDHTEIDRWDVEQFPFDLGDELEREALHDVLPDGYWYARDYSTTDEFAIVLMEAQK